MNPSTSSTPELDTILDLVGKDTPKALQLCEKYRQENPHNNWVYHVMTMAHRRMDNHAAAHATADICVQREPQKHSAYYHRAEAAYELGKYPEAISDAMSAIKLNRTGSLGSMPHRLIALCYTRQGDTDNAVAAASQIPELEPKEWFPPFGPLPAGTKSQIKNTVRQFSENVRQGKVL
jgi:tetratricopeptide (TPR) repeat protein